MRRLLLPLLLLAAAGRAEGFDFDKYRTCKSCVKAGKGWCPIARRCGNFANDNCDVGERYFGTRELYLVATIKRLKKKAKKGDEAAKEEVQSLKEELKRLREELAEDEDGAEGEQVVAAEEGEEVVASDEVVTESAEEAPAEPPKRKKRRRRRRRERAPETPVEDTPAEPAEPQEAGADDDGDDDDVQAEVDREAAKRKKAARGRKPRKPDPLVLTEGAVLPLGVRNFSAAVLDSQEPWLVEFYSPFCSMCKMFAPEYERAAAKLAGKVRCGAVDADRYKKLGSQYGVGGFPSLFFFMRDKAQPQSASVPWRMSASDPLTEDAVAQLALKHAEDMGEVTWRSDPPPAEQQQQEEGAPPGAAEGSCAAGGALPPGAIALTPKNFKANVLDSDAMWLVAFTAPEVGGIPCPQCAALQTEWEHAAKVLRGVVRLGVVDADKYPDLLRDYDVDSFPAVRAWVTDDKQQMPKAYSGQRDAASIVDWVFGKLQRLAKDREKRLQRKERYGK
eukprot:TRINITY_DN2357_c3_g1_i1.p1 TRINITY_DN2357_c3_g1~~TRINITY_DN2357_c3_g1_i1.p1  ORF type:complete len:530 (+),score=203.74 TRINITY_DN2357_c3_g1_i1:76-1590(+)